MPGFDALYKQTVTLFNRLKLVNEETLWYPTVLEAVHLVMDESSSWGGNGGVRSDNVRLHVRYTNTAGAAFVAGKKYYAPKEYRRLLKPEEAITFGYGNNDDFDFFVEGEFAEFPVPISDASFERRGFYNYMNARYDHVFAITSVSKYNLIPHFEIMAR